MRGMLTLPDRPSRGLVLRSEVAKESTMIDIRYLGAALDYTEKDFDAALIRTQALTLASEAFARGAGRFGARRTHHNDTTAHG